ncbi:MAG: DUF1579 domain-containing protein [Planctomycetota bacterium]
MNKQHVVGWVFSLGVFSALGACSSSSALVEQTVAEEQQQPPQERAWLQQLVGAWEVTTSAEMGPGTKPMEMKGSESVSWFGDLWVVGDGSVSLDGQEFQSCLTLGYDERQEAFVGTWVDTLQSHLWVYRGELDEGGKVLSLLAEGPSFTEPDATATYRDSIEIVSPDHRVLRSAVEGADGEWTQFMEAHYRRKR